DLATVPAGRCVTGNRFENVWPSKSGECAGTLGYFERGPPILGSIQENTVGGIPCLADGYSAALAAFSVDPGRDDTQIVALESVNGPSSMCPGNGTCAMKKCVPIDASTGVVACVDAADCPNLGDSCVQANDNSGNCQAFDARPSFCLSDPNVACGIDVDCPKTCSGGSQQGQPCTNSLLDCKNGVGTNPGDCVPIPSDCTVAGNDFESALCGGEQARCSDGDPDLEIGGLGLGFCVDIVIIGQVDTSVDCGRNAGAPVRSSPRNVLENPPFLFTPQRDPGTGFLGKGAIRRVRSTSMARVQTAADASANTLGIRSVQIQGDTAWWDALFSADDVNGALDRLMLTLPCDPPEDWETQLPVEGSCTPPNQGVFCIEDADCPSGACENLFFCHERRDPNHPALGPALDSVGFLWQRDIVDNEPIPLGLPDAFRDPNGDPIWSTDPLAPTCPPLCGTAYDHTTFETEAISSVRAQDRASGFQLALDLLGGPRAGRGNFLTLGSGTTVEFVNIGDIRCRIGGQEPSDLTDLGTCTSSGVPCDPDNPVVCASGEACRACAGRLIRAGDPLELTRGLNSSALPLGYSDQGFAVLKLIENARLGVLNGFPTTVQYSVFTLGTNGAAAATFTDAPPCIATADRCVLGETPTTQPGSVGIGAGGTFSDGQPFAHGGSNIAGTDVSWSPEDPPGVSANAYVRAASIGVGPDGIPGCMGNNNPRNNGADACRRRLARGQETGQQDPNATQAKWGFCEGGAQGWLPGPPPVCQGNPFFSCRFPYGDTSPSGAICGPKVMEFNTGADDPEILMPVEDPNTAVEATKGRFLVPDPTAAAPTLHWVGATTKRDLDLFNGIDNTDLVLKADRTLCPVDPGTGISICAGRCTDLGGDTDRDGVCDAGGPNV
ncbi:MAG: hypothetical protein V3T24_08570, partial [Longimicrobiales bacterium]